MRIVITVINLVLTCVMCLAEVPSTTQEEVSDSLSRQLQEVIVTADIPAKRLSGNTVIYTVVGSSLQNIGTALDVLAQLPMVTVADDAVSIVGKGSPEIYIDGRLLRDRDELSRLQSDNIRKVELDMAPGAMYDGDTQAVLRISTRRDFIKGLSLTDRAVVEKRRRWRANDMLDLNYRSGDWDIFANGLVGRDEREIRGVTTNSLIYDGRPAVIGASQSNRVVTTAGAVKAGFNNVHGHRSLGMSYRYEPEKSDFTNTGAEWTDSGLPVARLIDRTSDGHSHHVSAYYDDTFADKYTLHFDGDFKTADSSGSVTTSYPGGAYDEVGSAEHRRSSLWAARLYASMPLWSGKLTFGTQDAFSRSRLDYLMRNPEVEAYIPSSLTDVSQVSAALFATWRRSFGKFDLSAGVRYEYVSHLFKLDGRKDDDVSRSDHLFAPDMSLGYRFNDKAQLSLSYQLATVRPPYSQLTGSLSYVGRHEIEGGNPALRDERMHSLQLSGIWGDFMLQAYCSRSIDTYGFVKRVYPAPTIQLLMQPVNMDVTSIDAYLVWNRQIGCWSPGITAGVHKQWLEIATTRYGRPILSYYFDNVISLPYGLMLTANVRGQSSGDIHTNRFGAEWFVMDASVSKSFLEDSLRLRLSATDIFATANNDWTMDTYGVHVDKRQSYDNRGVALSLTYRFQPSKSRYKGEAASEAELNRF